MSLEIIEDIEDRTTFIVKDFEKKQIIVNVRVPLWIGEGYKRHYKKVEYQIEDELVISPTDYEIVIIVNKTKFRQKLQQLLDVAHLTFREAEINITQNGGILSHHKMSYERLLVDVTLNFRNDKVSSLWLRRQKIESVLNA